MKIKLISVILCFAMALLLSGCKVKNNGGGENEQKECTHIYEDGVCKTCGETDPNYVPESGNEEEEQPEDKEDNSEIPPIDTDGETELPFVPAV